MRVSCEWLKEFVDVHADPEKLSMDLTMAGLEVDACEPVRLRDGREDHVLEIGLTPNRPDCLSILGIAREIAALTGKPLKGPTISLEESEPAVDQWTSVNVEEPEMCPRYAVRVISGIQVGPSPDWLAERLEAVGQRSINNVVDITNYVMLELGQPLHAFDYDRLHEKRIIVRRARREEVFEAIDRTVAKLHTGALVIADADRPVALAGVMGGANSEVTGATGSLLLECAYFQPEIIRKASRKFKIHSESSHRFERGTDPNAVGDVIDYAASLILKLCGGKVARGRIDHYPAPISKLEIHLRVDRVNKILGTRLQLETIKGHLEQIALRVVKMNDGDLLVAIPTFRPDLTREIDLIEEVARLTGYHVIPSDLPKGVIAKCGPSPLHLLESRTKQILAGFGLQEIITYSFISGQYLDYLQLSEDNPLRNGVPILNPISQEQNVLRPSLIPTMLETMARNIRVGVSDLMLFEVGRVFRDRDAGHSPGETPHLIVAVTGRVQPGLWHLKKTARDFYTCKGILEAFCERLNMEPLNMELALSDYLVRGESVSLKTGEATIGEMGEVRPRALKAFDVGQRVFLFEVTLDSLLKKIQPTSRLNPIPRFPSTLRDLSIVVKKSILAEQISRTIQETGGAMLKKVFLFDLFEGGNITRDKRCLTYSLSFRSDTRTLTDEEVDRLQHKILDALAEKFDSQLR